MHTVDEAASRLERAKAEYLREAAAVDRELQACVRVDPSHLKAAHGVQRAMTVVPDRLELKANEQPDAEVEVEAPKRKKK